MRCPSCSWAMEEVVSIIDTVATAPLGMFNGGGLAMM